MKTMHALRERPILTKKSAVFCEGNFFLVGETLEACRDVSTKNSRKITTITPIFLQFGDLGVLKGFKFFYPNFVHRTIKALGKIWIMQKTY